MHLETSLAAGGLPPSRKRIGFLVAVISLSAVLSSCRRSPEKPPPRDYRNVVLIGWDGARQDRFSRLLEQGRLPNIRKLIDEGSWVPTRVTTGNTQTKPGWSEILTGYSAVRLGITSNKEYRPIPAGYTLFERLKAHFGDDDIATIFLGGKRGNIGDRGPHSIAINALSRDPDTHEATRYQTKDFTGLTERGEPPRWVEREGEPFHFSRKGVDEFKIGLGPAGNVTREAVKALTRFRARRFFAFIHFAEPDEQGHLFGESSTRYEEGMAKSDAQLGEIVSALKGLGIYDRTRIYVTTDHGMDKGGFAHSAAPDTFLATNSRRRLVKGDRKDVTPTLLEELGVRTADFSPPLDGRSLIRPLPHAASSRPVRVGYFLGGRTAILLRMIHDGEFEHRGLNVELWSRGLRDAGYHPLDAAVLAANPSDGKVTGTELIDGMLAGRWDLSTPGESSFLAAVAAGKPVVAIAMLGHDVRGNSGHLFALRREHRISSAKDYLGKLFVSRRAGPGDAAFLLEYLSQQGVDLDRDAMTLKRIPRSMEERRALPKDKVIIVHNALDDDLMAGVQGGTVDGGFFHLKPFEEMTGFLKPVRPLHHWADPNLSLALLVCRKDFLKDPARREFLRTFLSAYLERIRYENSMTAAERTVKGEHRWRAMDSPTPGYNYPQYELLPVVDTAALKQMAELLSKYRLLDWKNPRLEDSIDDRLLRETAAKMGKDPG